jgi:hypothetical protein
MIMIIIWRTFILMRELGPSSFDSLKVEGAERTRAFNELKLFGPNSRRRAPRPNRLRGRGRLSRFPAHNRSSRDYRPSRHVPSPIGVDVPPATLPKAPPAGQVFPPLPPIAPSAVEAVSSEARVDLPAFWVLDPGTPSEGPPPEELVGDVNDADVSVVSRQGSPSELPADTREDSVNPLLPLTVPGSPLSVPLQRPTTHHLLCPSRVSLSSARIELPMRARLRVVAAAVDQTMLTMSHCVRGWVLRFRLRWMLTWRLRPLTRQPPLLPTSPWLLSLLLRAPLRPPGRRELSDASGPTSKRTMST